MRLILNGNNADYLQNITLNHAADTEEVWAAVAYATESSLLFDWCWDFKIPLKFWGRLDDRVAVSLGVLDPFLKRKSPNYVCKLVQHHHAKVIWWRGVGIYIGSANLTNKAWTSNVEAGCFFREDEIDSDMAMGIDRLFKTLDANATPLTDELYNLMVQRTKEIVTPPSDKFWSNPSLKKWGGLVQTAPKTFKEQKKKEFLDEWYSTLQDLRNIGDTLSSAQNRPTWVNDNTPKGAQTDQFLHAHYYQRTFDGRKAEYQSHYESNRNRRDTALQEAIVWWSKLKAAPQNEDKMLNVTAPFLQKTLSPKSLLEMTYEGFEQLCFNIHAVTDYSRRVPNRKVSLPEGKPYTIPEKVTALATHVWHDRSGNGSNILQVLSYVLYGGTTDLLPTRLWDAVENPDWQIEGFGVSTYGEIVGWAMPETFPPRNGRTSKALRSLGYDVRIHVQ